MILGMTTQTFTVVHTALSLIGIVSGFVVMYGLLSGKRLDRWTALFLLTTVLTSVTGFFFPFDHLLPSHKVGITSCWCWRLQSWRATLFTSPADSVGLTC